jgi:transcriptional regulator with PAS, ATPase and Fis domain
MASANSTLAEIKRDAELARITEALQKHSNNRLRAASELGISRMTLYKKLYKYGLMNPSQAARREGN